MKLVIAIVSNEDSNEVQKALIKERFFVTKLASTGGFLKKGNTTFMIGCDLVSVNNVINIISDKSKTRTKLVPNSLISEYGMYTNQPIEVKHGGATIFIVDVADYKKI